jgi:excisionase family DNA binding protein
MQQLAGYLRISEAARYLGVPPNTLRNWVNAGKVAAIRHPLIGYRLFKRADLDALRERAAVADTPAGK